MNRKYTALLMSTLLLTGCLKSDDGDGAPEKVRDYVEITNLDSSRFPWHVAPFREGIAQDKLKRWEGTVPVKLNGSSVAEKALDEIEKRLGVSLFDRTSIANTPDEDITRGLIVSLGTARGGDGRGSCGNVSDAPHSVGYPSHYHFEAGSQAPYTFYNYAGVINTKLYVNIGSSSCDARLNIAIHEFGHALGLGEHFDGFGKGAVINDNFWKVLLTIYENNAGTNKEDLLIRMK